MRLSSLEAIIGALNDRNVPFLVVDGLAVAAHGYGRQTRDLDLVVRLVPETVHGAFEALESLGYRPLVPVTADGFADLGQRARWIKEKGMTVLNFHSDLHPETPVDIFVEEPFSFQDEYERAGIHEIAPGVALRVVRLDTLLRMKEEAGRPQDLADIAELKLLHEDPDA